MNGNRFCDRKADREERGPKFTVRGKVSTALCVLGFFVVLGAMPEARQESLTAGVDRHQVMAWTLTEHPDYSRCAACHDGAGMIIRRELLTIAGVGR